MEVVINTTKTLQINSNYYATTDGKIYNAKTNKLNEGGHSRRYLRCKINGKEHHIHRLIAETFIPNPLNKPQVNHINGNKHDNRVENLEWVTAAENNLHARVNKLAIGPKKGEDSNLSKIDNETIRYIKSIHKPFTRDFGTRALAKRYGISECWLSNVLNGSRREWK